MIYFLTAHGTLITRDREGLTRDREGGLGHAGLRDIPDVAALLALDIPIDLLRQDYQEWLQRQSKPPVAFALEGFGEGRLHVDAERNLVHIERDGRFLSAGRDGGTITWIDRAPELWESFLPLFEADLGRIVTLVSGLWIIRSTRTLVRGGNVDLLPGFILRFGPIDVPLPQNLPLDARQWPFRVTVLLEGWRIEEICWFKPLIYYAAFRSPAVHAQLFNSIQSLLEFGRYDGHLHLMTDLSHEDVCRAVPQLGRDRLTVQPVAPDDFVGFVASKYAILEHEPAWQHQPVVFLDPDIVVNASLREMLIEIALSDRIVAPIERVGPMRTWPSVGASLIQRDGHDPRFADGFNAGTLGLPNLAWHAHTLRLIRRIIGNILKAEGRDALRWVDQEVANYVSFRSAHVDTSAISRFVRFGSWGDADAPGLLNGMVHFWHTGKHDRHVIMARYIEALRAHARAGHHLT